MQVFENGAALSFREFFARLEESPEFSDWYSDALLASSFAAFFWEFPPLTDQALDQEAEFVLIESTALAGLRADPAPFQSQFALHPDADVITFENLGGDALLIAPVPRDSTDDYAHLAAFLRHASPTQVKSLWQITARCVHECVSQAPRWLSTAGFGVAWLHLRLDSRPKYYRFAPYKVAGS